MSVNLSESFLLAGQYLRRNPFLALTAVLVMTLTFFTTSVFVGAAATAGAVLQHLESKAQITVFFRNDVQAEKILALKDSLESSGRLVEVKYISAEEALKIYLGQHQDEPTLLESISANIFPPSLEVRAKSLADLPQIAREIEEKEGVEEVVFFKSVVETFRRYADTARLAGLTLIAVLAAISVLITLIVIGMTIYGRREEIEVMRLVGATENYIRLPFVIQGVFYGLFASVFSITLFIALIPFVTPYLDRLVGNLPARFPLSDPLFLLKLLSGEVVFGVVLGALGSAIAVRKYLRV